MTTNNNVNNNNDDKTNTRKRNSNNPDNKPKTQRKYLQSSNNDGGHKSVINGDGNSKCSYTKRTTRQRVKKSQEINNIYIQDNHHPSVELNNNKKQMVRSTNPFLASPHDPLTNAVFDSCNSSKFNNIVKRTKHVSNKNSLDKTSSVVANHNDNINNIFLSKSGSGLGQVNITEDKHNAFISYPNHNGNVNNININNNDVVVRESGTNYFIHNSKIQSHRRQKDNNNVSNYSDTVKTKDFIHSSHSDVVFDVKDTILFPSLKTNITNSSSCGSSTTTSTSSNKSSVWTQNKIKDIILFGISGAGSGGGGGGGDSSTLPSLPISTITIDTTSENIPSSSLSVSPLPASPLPASVYNPPNIFKVKNTPLLSRDNIFLAAFNQHPIVDIDNSSDSNTNSNGNTVSTSSNEYVIPTSILVDTCDSRYDRLYNGI